IAWSISQIEHNEIDANGIQWANYNVLEKAVASLQPSADYVLSDGFLLKSLSVPHLAITKGDALSLSIAAASVLAKVTRDRIMDEYDSKYPQYGFARHKGYGTLLHKRALEKYGLSPIHRNYFVASFL
ncbi:MAG: ribonuclease HII, partial [Actinomycetota bacterium]|nr:ribonuclease HII [Actinomycetota bacterium]